MHSVRSELGALPSWMFIALAILGVVLAMALVGNKKAREVFKVLLVLGGVVLFLGFFLMFGLRATRDGPHRYSVSSSTEPAPGVRIERDGDEMIVDVGGAVRIERDGDETVVSVGGVRLEQDGEEVVMAVKGKNPVTGAEKGPSAPPKAEAEKTAQADEPDNSTSDRQTDTSGKQPPPAEAPKKAVAADSSAETDERPEWVDWEEGLPHKVDKTCQMRIAVGPYSTRSECNEKLPARLHAAIDEYAAVYVGPEARKQVRLPLDYLRSHVVQAEWPETVDIGITGVSAIQLHVLLEFDHEVNAIIKEQWDRAIVNGRLAGVGGLTLVVLLLLSAVYGYLKIDLTTGGRYRGRLRLAAVGLILLLIVAGFAFAVDSAIIQDPF